jgi:DNA polymerase-1
MRILTDNVKKPFTLIDADLYLYRAAAAAEEETDWGDDIWSLSTDLKEAKVVFEDFLDATEARLKNNNFILCLTNQQNFRKELNPLYKSNRRKVRKPVGYKALVDWAKGRWQWWSEPYMEADDVMGILSTVPGSKATVVSDDKDLKSIPGRLYRPMTDEILQITEDQADRWFYSQALTGDPTDGYVGLRGCGPKTAEKILGSRPEWSLVERAYIKAGKTKEDALLQARMARILRYTDWDETTATIKLWEPDQ